MFERVLIANRGEIACRIQRTLRALGVAPIAVYSEADRHARHVLQADQAICVGPAPAKESYLDVERVLDAARQSGAQAIHPGYGFLSENPKFAEACEAQGIAFIGPTPAQMRAFGLKHSARELAEKAEVPLLPGTGLLRDAAHARDEARRIGFPLMLKSSAGGGGIGMQLVRDEAELAQAFETVQRLSRNNFGDASVFLERFVTRARHIEVQLFGDGRGRVVTLGERDCSAQRRNQKVIEETPAPGLDTKLRQALHGAALRLGESVAYRSAGTVEFVFDVDRQEFYFLEVNTRLQVEHGVTEAVTGIDLVEWMLKTAAGDPPDLSRPIASAGHSIEVRVYAEDPARDFKPCAGLLTEVSFPSDVRVDGWVERGSEVSAFYDPMLAKLIVRGDSRSDAVARLQEALEATRIAGIETNVPYLRALCQAPEFLQGEVITSTLKALEFKGRSIEVQSPGTFSMLVDYPGRLGYWDVGVPPSGPMDELAQRLGNRIVGNDPSAASLELTMRGPTLRFSSDACIALTGARMAAELDGVAVDHATPTAVRAGQTLKLGSIVGSGARSYLAVQGGFAAPRYLGSRTTFTLGGFGGHGGRTLRRGDVLHIDDAQAASEPGALPLESQPKLESRWEIGVLYGPHAAPDFFTERDIEMFFGTDWEVHYNSNRTGVRLLGPKPEWARSDGGEAGLHPSNIHDVAYAIGAVDFTGDMPIVLGPDGPSLGGFVCPATVVAAELWKLGQLRPGDRVRFMPLTPDAASELERAQNQFIETLGAVRRPAELIATSPTGAVAEELPQSAERVRVVYRRAGDKNLLVEYGPLVLDLRLRFRVHALMNWLQASGLPGIVDFDARHPFAANPLRPSALVERAPARRAEARRNRATSRQRGGGTDAHRAPAAVVGRPRDAPGDRKVYAIGAPERALGPEQHRVHPPHQRPRLDRASAPNRVRSQLPGARPRRRIPGRPRGDADRSAPPAGHHQVQPSSHVDARKRGRHRRRVPVHLRHGRPRRLSVRRTHAAGLQPLPAHALVQRGDAVALALLRPNSILPSECGRAARNARRVLARQGRARDHAGQLQTARLRALLARASSWHPSLQGATTGRLRGRASTLDRDGATRLLRGRTRRQRGQRRRPSAGRRSGGGVARAGQRLEAAGRAGRPCAKG
ncbi:MAG: urea carboxylase [Polyangiaceae bacterium]